MQDIAKHIFFSGRVQGVGFRFTTRHVAREFEVTGTVRNLSDGRVELVAEGAPEELDRFVRAIEARMGPYIADVSASESPAAGTFDRFEIAL